MRGRQRTRKRDKHHQQGLGQSVGIEGRDHIQTLRYRRVIIKQNPDPAGYIPAARRRKDSFFCALAVYPSPAAADQLLDFC